MSTKRTSKKLHYPLTEKALQGAFEPLQPESIYVSRQGAEATIDGAWSLSTLRKHFSELEFVAIGHPDSLLFVNRQRTIGFQCQGVDPHPKKNTWKTYCVEVQSRSSEEAQRLKPLERSSMSAPGAFPSQSNLFGL